MLLSDEEAAGFEAEENRRQDRDLIDPAKGGANYPPGGVVPYNEFWYDRGNRLVGSKRTSLIVDPPDGRLPPRTPEGERRAAARAADGRDNQAGRPHADSYEDRPSGERCIVGFNAGPPMTPGAYNNNVEIVQTRGYVAIFNEMVHDARIVPLGAGIANNDNPIVTSVLNANRTWNDTNGNYIPDCVLTNFAANGECGVISNANFGKNNPAATRWDPELLTGFAQRTYAWDFSTEVQHQLLPGLSMTAGYYRNWSGNYRATDNLAVTPADYSPFCVTAPKDSRLPGGGGYQVCGLYDISPAKFGQTNNFVTAASQFIPDGSDVTCDSVSGVAGRNGAACGRSDFVGISTNARLSSGIQLGGGVDAGRTVIDRCFVVDTPQDLLNCRIVQPFKAQLQLKLFGTSPLPAGVMLSATFQNTAGASFNASYDATNVEILPSLGRDLAACGTRRGSACTATVSVPLIAPMTEFLERRNQLDLRLTKELKLGPRARLNAIFDIYNVLNANTVLAVNTTYGPAWQRPASDNSIGGVDPVLPARLFQVGGQFTF